jgi:hypothetical protein
MAGKLTRAGCRGSRREGVGLIGKPTDRVAIMIDLARRGRALAALIQRPVVVPGEAVERVRPLREGRQPHLRIELI